MKTTWIKLGIVVLIIGLAAMGCEEAGTASGPSVDGVDTAQLTAGVDSSDLADISDYEGSVPADEGEVLEAIGSGLAVIFASFSDYTESNDPPETGIVTDPTDLFTADYDLEPFPNSFSITANITNEDLDMSSGTSNTGILRASGEAGISVDLTLSENDVGPERLEVESSLDEIDIEVSSPVTYNGFDDVPDVTVVGGRVAMAINANVDADPAYDGTGEMTNLSAAYAMSSIIRIAISVGGNAGYTGPVGNYIAELQLGDSETIVLTEAMLADETGELLSQYLEQVIEPNVFSLTVDRYNDAGTSVEQQYGPYSVDDIIALVEEMQTGM